MPNNRRRIYWDACVFLSYINQHPERTPVIEELLAESSGDGGSLTIFTSTISITEVAFGAEEQQKRRLAPTTEARIDALWADRNAIKLVEYHELIGREARSLMRTGLAGGWSLKPADAMHLATAQRIQAAEFHTYDDKLLRYNQFFGFPIVQPHVTEPRLL